jgi:hypothetical protein
MGLSISRYGLDRVAQQQDTTSTAGRQIANRRGGRGRHGSDAELDETTAATAPKAQAAAQNPPNSRILRTSSDPKVAGRPQASASPQPQPAQPPSEKLRALSTSSSSTSELQFQVKTAEGDTVTLSLSAVQQSSLDKVSYRSPDGSLKAAQSSQSDSLNASLTVEGDLNEAELADIAKALSALSQGKTLDSLGTLASAQFSYSNRSSYTQTQISYVG